MLGVFCGNVQANRNYTHTILYRAYLKNCQFPIEPFKLKVSTFNV